MRVSNGQIEKLLEIQLKGAQRTSRAKDGSSATPGDSVNLSRRAAEVARAKGLAASAPPVREDKVARLHERIERGEYKVSADDLADKILSEARLGRILRKL